MHGTGSAFSLTLKRPRLAASGAAVGRGRASALGAETTEAELAPPDPGALAQHGRGPSAAPAPAACTRWFALSRRPPRLALWRAADWVCRAGLCPAASSSAPGA